MKQKILSASALMKDFGNGQKRTPVLAGIDLELYREDFTVVMGPSGAGKSTLLYVLSGMDDAGGGSVKVYAEDTESELTGLSEKNMAALRARHFGFVFQQTHLIESLTVVENILVAGYNSRKFSPAGVQERMEHLLERMGISETKDRFPGQVSGGEAQRAAIARAVINEPELLFADEPTGALNRANTEEILNIFSELHAAGQSILLVTHDAKAALRGTRIIYLEDGKITGELKLPPFEKSAQPDRERQLEQWLLERRW